MLDRFKLGLDRIVRRIVRQQVVPSVDYLALYHAKVIAQSSDGTTVDVVPDDARIPPMAAIPLRLDLPGVTAKFTASTANVYVGWDNGDPQKPFAALFDHGATLSMLTLNGPVTLPHVEGNGSAPIVSTDSTFNTAQGAVALFGGTDQSGQLTLINANVMTPWPGGVVGTVTFSSAFATAPPAVLVVPADGNTKGLWTSSVTAAGFTLTSGALATPGTWSFNYLVGW